MKKTVIWLILTVFMGCLSAICCAGAEDTWKLDPVSVMISIVDNEMETARAKITPEKAQIYFSDSSNDNYTRIINNYLASLDVGEREIKLYSVSGNPFLYRNLDTVLQAENIADIPSDEIVALSVMRKLHNYSGYCYTGHLSGIPDHIATVSANGTLAAIIHFSFDSDTAIGVTFLPMLRFSDTDMVKALDNYFQDWKPVDIPRLSEAEKAQILLDLRKDKGSEQPVEDIAAAMALKIGMHAKQYDPFIQMRPDAVRLLELSCRVYTDKPTKILNMTDEFYSRMLGLADNNGWEQFGMSADEFKKMLIMQFPSMIASNTDNNVFIAQEDMREVTSVAMPGENDFALLLVYENQTENPDLCYVCFIRNGNQCYDVFAYPILCSSYTSSIVSAVEIGLPD